MVSLFISSFSVLGAIQSFAGFTDYFTTMAQEGWFPLLCVGLRSQWENVQLQDLQDSYGQEWVCKLTNYSRECLYSHLHRNQVTPPLCRLLCLQTFSQRLYQEYTCYTVFFVSIEICQISDVLIRKTRRLSVFQQGFFRSVKTHP